jgi:diguanylate cyclase (GGDEF)-like protein
MSHHTIPHDNPHRRTDSPAGKHGQWLQEARKAVLSWQHKETGKVDHEHGLTNTLELLKDAFRIIDSSKQQFTDQERRIDRLEKILLIDELTGLLNKEGFTAQLERELDRIKRGQANEGLLVFTEIDNHKAIHLQYGPKAADKALQIVAAALTSDSRKMDILGRIYEDEFTSLLVQANSDQAIERAHFLIKKLNNLSFIWQENEVSICASVCIKKFTKSCKIETLLTRNSSHKDIHITEIIKDIKTSSP